MKYHITDSLFSKYLAALDALAPDSWTEAANKASGETASVEEIDELS
jgi:hypothetical protein